MQESRDILSRRAHNKVPTKVLRIFSVHESLAIRRGCLASTIVTPQQKQSAQGHYRQPQSAFVHG
jgi:hypothetical protein